MAGASRALAVDEEGGGGGTFAESPPPLAPCLQTNSYIATALNFLANILWMAIGVTLLALSRSYLHTGPRIVGAIIGAFGAVSLIAGVFL
jgi:hypothetical protein